MVTEKEQKLYKELDRSIKLLRIAKKKRSLIFIKGVVGYITKMCPNDLKGDYGNGR